jgi:hypothetical protein
VHLITLGETMKKLVLVAALGLALGACGGGDGGVSWKDPEAVNFTFGAPAAVVPSSPEDLAAQSGTGGIGTAMAFVDEADPNVAQDAIGSFAMMPNNMGNVFEGEVPMPLARALEQGETVALAQARALLATPAALEGPPVWDNPDCWSLSADQLVFRNCRMTIDDVDADGLLTVNGTFNRAPGHVSWNATFGITMTGPVEGGGTMTMRVSDRLHGDVVFSTIDGTIAGFTQSDLSAAISAQGRSESLAVTYKATFDLDYEVVDLQPCITAGTLTLKRVWSELPAGAAGDPMFENAAIQLSWTGCGSAEVAWGTLD